MRPPRTGEVIQTQTFDDTRPNDGERDISDGVLERPRGTVLACFHDDWEVLLSSGEIVRASVRARHFADLPKDQKLIAAGDRVAVDDDGGGTWIIEEVLPRATVLSRLLPGRRHETEQVIVANAAQLVAVASLKHPPFNRRRLDRFLVIAEAAGLESVVALNKIDLVDEGSWAEARSVYERAGYAVVPTCALDGRGVAELAGHLDGRLSVLAGASGAGKSSLLNAIEPGLGIRVREVSEKTDKGKHTTTNVRVFPLQSGALVADTPGFRELGFWRVSADDLRGFFPEFRELAAACRFRTCSHSVEPGCAVLEAVRAGEIDSGRHDSYLRLLRQLRGSN